MSLQLNSATVQAIKTEYYKRNFYEFRKMVAPWKGQSFIEGWWQREISKHISQFYLDLKSGLRPKLVIKSPPQFGKSQQVIDAISWIMMKDPNLRTVFTSYSERLGIRANLTLQRMWSNPNWLQMFPHINIGTVETDKKGSISKPGRNRELIDLWPHGGMFRNTTIGGPITGESLDLGIVDDFLKGRSDANSINTRDKTWEWFTDDFFTRFSERAGFLVIGTNWHVDDPMQRMIEKFPDIKVVSYPAIATQDEPFRKQGESLFPELKSLEFLLERKALMPIGNWEALYQQNPFVQGGEKFKDTMIDFRTMPKETDYEFIVVDTAYKSKNENDYQVATLFAMVQGELYVKDVWRIKMDAAEMEFHLAQFINRHKKWNFRQVWIEPKGHGIYLNQKFATQAMGIPSENDLKEFFADRRLDKIERANNSLPHLASRKLHINIDLAEKDDLKSELLQFPNGKHDDFVDTVIDGLKIAFGRTPSILDVL